MSCCPYFLHGNCQAGWSDAKVSIDEAEDGSWTLWACDGCGTEWKEASQ